ncbi:hypothetical protein [Singulisphaera acidiphila]|uniref:Uncharacterized protein n=1 Tax=Singulisphaera acidiphila (strain ATCC BAA-1392 / DSM 18658 / VKM B-2454 / MOB10) TaxID=886293 RepID=L0DJS6_SINAD|nr:hypothetical protein [Singulisphaera acidiphila]AGA29100.1 hypothetical protein Sinac_4944 [Singulisphaera acidiphila DSM 18658]
MTQSSNDLSQEVSKISDLFSSLSERLLGAARQLHSPGSPPPEGLIEELGQARREFVGLRDRTRERAEALHVALPSSETLDTVQGLTAVLDLVAESEVRQSKAEESRRRALSVLDRVLNLTHSADHEFAPLRDCQNQARTLRETIADGPWTVLPPETEPLSEGEHPFASLLTLVEDRDVLNDDLWGSLHDTIGSTFGRSLAAAAARSKLVPSPSS